MLFRRMPGHMPGSQGGGPQQMMSASSMNPQSTGHVGSGASPQVRWIGLLPLAFLGS